MSPPHEPAPIDRFCRLFPPSEEEFDLGVMTELGLSMERAESRIPRELERHPPPAAYTYFGQLIDHDLTFDETPLAEAIRNGTEPTKTRNTADARLNLHPLYGDGPGSPRHGHLYECDGASFRLGETRNARGEPFDFPLGPDGPETANCLNLENLILRQLSVMLLKLHNLAVRELPETLAPEIRFAKAKERVCWQYQWLVRHDYLYQVTNRQVYAEVLLQSRYRIDWRTRGFSIPVEFSQAVFRFGHSMVRSLYDLNRHQIDVPLEKLFGLSVETKAIDSALAIEWGRLVDTSAQTPTGRNRMPAMAIDTSLVPALFHLPPTMVHPGANLPGALAVRTLLRSASARVVTGEEICRAWGISPLAERALAGGDFARETLAALGLSGWTPLWHYILLEAETEMLGVRLGTLGSHFVIEVLDGCLRSDPKSYLSRFGPGWRPAPWTTEGGKKELRTLADLARVTNLF